MLHYRADLRSLLYIFLTTSLFIGQWIYGFHWLVYIVYLHLAISVAVMTHNHQHINMWKSSTLNVLTDWWLTVFYGVPIFTWIPTHNRNHHRFVNKVGDTTATYRHTEENNLFSLLSYPTVSGRNQLKEGIIPYMAKLRTTDRSTFYKNWAQVIVLAVWIIGFLIFDWRRALVYVVIPQQVSAFVVMIFNYIQHVHADEESEYDHSRNFLGVNYLYFNNGYHTAHHQRAGIHWSLLPQEHAKIAHLIKPELIEKTMWGFLIRTYIVGAFIPRYRTPNRRQERLMQMEK
jgi:beta-carotene hydroxylase